MKSERSLMITGNQSIVGGRRERTLALTSINIIDLLGNFNHRIQFPVDWPFVIIYGPNGVGKTKLLEIIQAAFSNKPDRLARFPFRSVEFGFDDGQTLEIAYAKESARLKINPAILLETRKTRTEFDIAVGLQTLGYTYHDKDGKVYTWTFGPIYAEPTPEILDLVSRLAPVTQVAGARWRDLTHDDIIDGQELFSRYSELLSMRLSPTEPAPTPLLQFLDEVKVYLIETQRLLTKRSPRRPQGSVTGLRKTSGSRVNEYAEDLVKRIKAALAQNSTVTQRLDRSFPRRLVERGIPNELPPAEDIRQRHNSQREIRNELADIDVSEMGEDLPLPPGNLPDWQRTVLWSYLEDAEEKLATFRPLLSRVTIFRNIINSRFRFKQLVIDRERGFIFKTSDGTELTPDMLSSGEQHELVLLYDLVFNVPRGTLVLIDEPEISLHVAWQQRFLSDITKIADLNRLRFIIATHSPQVVHKSWSRAVALASENEDVE